MIHYSSHVFHIIFFRAVVDIGFEMNAYTVPEGGSDVINVVLYGSRITLQRAVEVTVTSEDLASAGMV